MAILQKPLGSAQEPPPEPWDASDVNDDADGGSFISEGLVGAPRSGMLGRAMQSPPLLEAHLSLPATQKEATGTGERGAIAARHFDDDGESGAPGLWTHMDWRLETAMTEGVARATVDSGGGSMVQPAEETREQIRLRWLSSASMEPRADSTSKCDLDAGADRAPCVARNWRVVLHMAIAPQQVSVTWQAADETRVLTNTLPRLERSEAEAALRRGAATARGCWHYEGSSAALVLLLPRSSSCSCLEATVTWPAGERYAEWRPLLSGLAGVLSRAARAKALMDATYPETNPQDYDQVTWLAGAAPRLSYAPFNATHEAMALREVRRRGVAQVEAVLRERVREAPNVQRCRHALALMRDDLVVRDSLD